MDFFGPFRDQRGVGSGFQRGAVGGQFPVESGEGVACGVQDRCVVGLGVFQVVEDVFDVVGVEGFGEPGVEGFGELVFA
ncbi:hypothetical protein AB0H42_17175 [Nocardia sp. NPDC050799]|uniref:hypothetical protein n=1 Tax=Nocardia sp. NPDC050799 TaxID=3154842 RepID=UPI0034040A10